MTHKNSPYLARQLSWFCTATSNRVERFVRPIHMVTQETRDLYWFRPKQPYVQCDTCVLEPNITIRGYNWSGEEEKPPSPVIYSPKSLSSAGENAEL